MTKLSFTLGIIAASITILAIAAFSQSDFSGSLAVQPAWTHTKTTSIATINESFSRLLNQSHTYGTNANQMTAVVQLNSTLTNSATATIELNSGVVDSFGSTVQFKRVNVFAVKNTSTNEAIHVGGYAGSFASWIDSTNSYVVVKPGGLVLFTAPNIDGYSSTSGTLNIKNASTNNVSYSLLVAGIE
jgi:hypothetical protein